MALVAVVVALVVLGVTAMLVVGPVPERRPPTSPDLTGDFDIWPFF